MRSFSRRRSLMVAAGVALVGLGIGGWGLAGWPGIRAKPVDAPVAATRPKPAPVHGVTNSKVRVAGTVIDRTTRAAVGSVDVVLFGSTGELTTTAAAGGTFELVVPAGRYRAWVRSRPAPAPDVLSVGMIARVRVDEGPRSELADVADPALAPMLDATADVSDLDLLVERAGVVTGFVFDADKHQPVENAVVRLVGPLSRIPFPRPVLGTDITRSDVNGKFTLRAPAGNYEIEATHEKFAGGDFLSVTLTAGREEHLDIDLVRGCIISGRVVRSDGSASTDGALERDEVDRPNGFGPVGRVHSDGTFHLGFVDEETVVLRAWPWKSPPAEDKIFNCKNGKRYPNTVLKLGNEDPDVTGTISNASGQRVPFAFVDLQPLDARFGGQQERADASGTWHVYDLLPGRYQVTATAPGLGITDVMINSPRADVQLTLGGTGRIAGTTTDLVNGSIEVAFVQCGGGNDPLELAPEPRIAVVRGGRFTIDDVPACALTFTARWRDQVTEQHVVIEANRTSYVELGAGMAREKTVHGIVRDKDRKPVSNARVTAVLGEQESATVRTDDNGRFTIVTNAGAKLVAGNGRFSGHAVVGHANVDSEQVDVALEDVESSF